MKDNALYEVREIREVPQNRNILKDEIIRLTGTKAEEKCPYPLRRVEAYDPETDRVFVFLSNHLQLGASTNSAVYKDRWQVEQFFKALNRISRSRPLWGRVPMR